MSSFFECKDEALELPFRDVDSIEIDESVGAGEAIERDRPVDCFSAWAMSAFGGDDDIFGSVYSSAVKKFSDSDESLAVS